MDLSKRYLLFIGDNHYPSSGLGDFVLSSDKIPTLLRMNDGWGHLGYLSLELLESNRLVYLDHPEYDSPNWDWHYRDEIDPNDENKSRVNFSGWYEVYDAFDLSNVVEVEPKIVEISDEELKKLQEKYTYTPK